MFSRRYVGLQVLHVRSFTSSFVSCKGCGLWPYVSQKWERPVKLFSCLSSGWLSVLCALDTIIQTFATTVYSIYHCLVKERPCAEHLTSLSKSGLGALSSISTFNHEECLLQRLDALEVNNWTNSNVQQNHKQLCSPVLMVYNILSAPCRCS